MAADGVTVNSVQPGTHDTARIRSALDAIDPDIGHDEWVRIGMALHAGYHGGAEGLAILNWRGGMGWASSSRDMASAARS